MSDHAISVDRQLADCGHSTQIGDMLTSDAATQTGIVFRIYVIIVQT